VISRKPSSAVKSFNEGLKVRSAMNGGAPFEIFAKDPILNAVADDIVSVVVGNHENSNAHFVEQPLEAIDNDAFVSRPRLTNTPLR